MSNEQSIRGELVQSTDDEREVLQAAIEASPAFQEYAGGRLADAILAAGFRRSEVSEPPLPPEIMDRVLIAGMEALGYDVKKPKKTLRWLKGQGEPSGAQVQAALEAGSESHE